MVGFKDYAGAASFLGKRESKKTEYVTYAHKVPDGIAVRQHSTDIVTYYKDGTVQLTSGGWRTPTTKDRLCRYTGLRIGQEKGVWFIYGETKPDYLREVLGIFQDGMKIMPDGSLQGMEEWTPSVDKENRKTKRMIREYCLAYIREFASLHVPAPSNGDCFFCLLRTEDGRTLGESAGGHDHIAEHIRERYYVPSLLARAVERFPIAPLARDYLCACWNPGQDGAEQARDSEWCASFGKESLYKSLYRYVCQQYQFCANGGPMKAPKEVKV